MSRVASAWYFIMLYNWHTAAVVPEDDLTMPIVCIILNTLTLLVKYIVVDPGLQHWTLTQSVYGSISSAF